MIGKRVLCSLAFVVLVALQHQSAFVAAGFAGTSGTHFTLNGNSFYPNGFNAYWLMDVAYDPSQRGKVSSALEEAASRGLKLVRTWAFSDGGSKPMQSSPGVYDEKMFQSLDFVISEAKKNGIYLILTLVNNWNDYGGKYQYVQWAKDQGHYLNSEDDFFKDDLVKGFYKNHIEKVATRINTITGVAYKDDPIIFAWELMNEPRCQTDTSGATLQAWVEEMAAYVKSIDNNHMLTIGMEGFYGESVPDRKQYNPGYEVGTDFISNHMVSGVDFSTIHAYPDQWVGWKGDAAEQQFLEDWLKSHIEDSDSVLKKPILVSEFGKSSRNSGFSVSARDTVYSTVYDAVYNSARMGGAGVGGLFWQLMAQGMDGYRDGYEIILEECASSTINLISQQSNRLASLDAPEVSLTSRKSGMKKKAN